MNEQPRPGRTLLASAKRLTGESLQNRIGQRSLTDQAGWQDDAWDMYDLVGEQRFLANTLAARTGQARLYIGKVETPDSDPVRLELDEVENDYLLDLGTSGHVAQMLFRLSCNLFMAGEGWLVGIPVGEDGEERITYEWHMLSVSEVNSDAHTGKVKLRLGEADGGEQEFDSEDLWLVRIWRPHPRYHHEADSATKASLPILREIVSLSMAISAQVDSRLAGAGILIIPEGVRRALATAAGLPEESDEDPFTEALIEAMMTPIQDRGSASALVPLTVTVPDELTKSFEHLSFSSNIDSEARALRDDAIRRLANSQDAPPELLLGTAGMNHWGGWLVKEETIRSHVEPPLALICDALTSQYLHPMMVEDGYTEEEAQQYVVWYDVSHLYSRPNRSGDAKDLHERGVLSDEALLRETGFDPSDAPEEAEGMDPAVALAVSMVQKAPSLAAVPGLPLLVEQLQALLTGTEPPPTSPSEPETTLIPETSEEEPEAPREEAPQ